MYKVVNKKNEVVVSYNSWKEAIAMVRYYYRHAMKGYKVVVVK